jgi:hypothetical protein
MPAAASRSSVSPSVSSSNDDMSTLSKYAFDAALRLLLPIYKDSGNHGQCPRHRQLRPKLRRPTNIPSWENGRTDCGQRCALSTSPVHRCSLPIPAKLPVDVACQRRDVAAAWRPLLVRQRWLAWRRRRGLGSAERFD